MLGLRRPPLGGARAVAGALLLASLAVVPAELTAQSSAGLEVRVSDAEGRQLRGARVTIRGLGLGGTTDDAGALRLFGLPSGSHTIEVRLLGFRGEAVSTDLAQGRMTALEVSLEPQPVALAGITVEGRSQRLRMSVLRGFYERRERGLGYFLTREEIEKRGNTDLSNVLRTVPGLRASPSQFGQARIRTARGAGGGPCRLLVYLDGMKYRMADDIPGIPVQDIEAIEVYRGRSELPGEFADTEANCGVLVIWSRRHRAR